MDKLKEWWCMNKIATVLAVACLCVPNANASLGSIDEILSGKHRSDKNVARDKYRHPKETIEFFGTKPTDHVIEMWPGTGWYSEILAPLVKDEGQFTAVTFATDNMNSDSKRDASWSKTAMKYKQKMSNSELYGDVQFNEFEPPHKLEVAKPNSADVAYVVRTMHIWDEEGILLKGLKSIWNALKPGGVLAVVQHRGTPTEGIGSIAVEGYLDERYVIDVAEKAGFKLVEKSEVNANVLDEKNYPKGVYTLPPTLAMGKKDRKKYLKIGESDRMTLKFIKPN